jgi:hypothetical protein
MKFIVSVLLTALLSFAAGLYLGWWSVAPAAFIVAIAIRQHPGKSWLAGFIGVFLLWGVLAWWIDVKNEGVLTKKIAALFSIGDNTFLLIVISAFIGALVAGFGALTGSFIHKRI